MHRWKLINDALSLGMAEPEETYSTSEHLYAALDIPREATGTLPRAMRERAGLQAEVLEDIGETGKIRTPRPSRRDRGSSRRGSGREGSGQARKSGAETAEGTPASEVTRTSRRRRRTRAGRDIGPNQTGPDQVGADQAGSGQADEGETRRKAS
jgi:hypothetical protein